MKRHFAAAVLIVVLQAGGTVTRAGELAELFPYQASLSADRSGLHRVELPPEVLQHCRADLSDLRVLGARGRELPYLVQARLAADAELEVVLAVAAEVLAAERHTRGSEHGPVRHLETYTLAIPPLPAEASSWELVLTTTRAEFVRSLAVTVEAGAGARHEVVRGGSLFRLARPAGERTRVLLPPVEAGRVVVELVGEDGSFLGPGFSFEARRSLAGGEPAELRQEVLERRDDADRTEVVLRRARGLAPSRLRLATTTGAFHRRVEVWDEGPTADSEALAVATLFRIDAIAPVEELELPLRPPRGDRLRVVIVNRDSPPLENVELITLVSRPSLFLSLPEGTLSATLFFGGGRAHRPDYDLAALRTARRLPLSGGEAERAALLWDPRQVAEAAVGQVVANPAYDPAPALAFAMHPGAALDVRRYSHRRALFLRPSSEGLARLRLEPEDLAVARPDLADLRVADDQGHQWAYLVDRSAATATAALTVDDHRRRQGRSSYRLRLPVVPMVVTELVLDTELSFFDRAFEVTSAGGGDEPVTLARGRLVRRRDDSRALVVALEPRRVEGLELVVHDGDDAPISFTRVDARSPQHDLFVAAPEGEYALYLGDPESASPRYELARIESTVLAVPSSQIEAGHLEDNPKFSAAARLASAGGLQRLALWIALGLAVVTLAALTLRLARQESE